MMEKCREAAEAGMGGVGGIEIDEVELLDHCRTVEVEFRFRSGIWARLRGSVGPDQFHDDLPSVARRLGAAAAMMREA
jgi:hypothetical protein